MFQSIWISSGPLPTFVARCCIKKIESFQWFIVSQHPKGNFFHKITKEHLSIVLSLTAEVVCTCLWQIYVVSNTVTANCRQGMIMAHEKRWLTIILVQMSAPSQS